MSDLLEPRPLRGVAPASTGLLERVRSKRRSITIAAAGSEELRFLDAMSANASCGGEKLDQIILLPDPRKIELLEEFLHGTQFRAGLVVRRTALALEVHVKEFMIRHQRLLGLTDGDVRVLEQMLGDFGR